MKVSGQVKFSGLCVHSETLPHRDSHCAGSNTKAPKVAPTGNRSRLQVMYCKAATTTMPTAGVTSGQNSRSFQSAQNDQSPANSIWLTWKAPITRKAAEMTNRKSQRRLSSGLDGLTSGAAEVVAVMRR